MDASSHPMRALCIRLSAMGDVLHTFPAVEALRGAHPGAHIAYLTDRRNAPLVRGCPAVDELLVLDKKALGRLHPRAWGDLIPLLTRLRGGCFDVVADFHSYPETGMLAHMTRAPRRAGRSPKGGPAGLWYSVALPGGYEDRPVADQHLELLQHAGLVPWNVSCPPLRLLPGPEDTADARAWIDSPGGPGEWSGPVVACFVGASKPEKCWPIPAFADIARRAVANGIGVVLVSGPRELPDCRAIEAAVGTWPGVPLWTTPIFPPLGVVAALRKLQPRVFVSNDTGPLHLGVASEVPVIGLFREPTSHFEPPVPPHTILRPSVEGDMATIPPDAVWDALQIVVSANKGEGEK